MIISLHIPKTAGTSFQKVLSSHFGKTLFNDYTDFPLAVPPNIFALNAEFLRFRNNIKYSLNRFKSYSCIHGHFLPYKYHCFKYREKNSFITWMRDPAERLASHYFFWQKQDPNSHPIVGKMKRENWSLIDFMFSMEMQNTTIKFFYKFPVSNFDFIGFTEDFDPYLRKFSQTYLNNSLVNVPALNKNDQRSSKYITDTGLIHELKQFHSKDYKIFSEAQELFAI